MTQTVTTGWQSTNVGSKINGSDNYSDYLTVNSLSFTLNKAGVYRCVFRVHALQGAAGRLGAAWFNGSTEISSDWEYVNTSASTAITELIINVESNYEITPKVYASDTSYTKYLGGHLTNFTIEYLGEL